MKCYMSKKSRFSDGKCEGNQWVSSQPYFADGRFQYACEKHARKAMQTNPAGVTFVCATCKTKPCSC